MGSPIFTLCRNYLLCKSIFFIEVDLQIFSSNFVVGGQNKNKWLKTNYFLSLKSQKFDFGFDQKNK